MYPDLLAQLAEEVRAFVPRIVECLSAYWLDAGKVDELHEAYRKLHTLVGDSAVVGERKLSRAILFAEETIEAVLEGDEPFDAEMAEFLTSALAEVEAYSQRIETDEKDPDGLLISVALLHRRFRKLPEEEDETVILELLGGGEKCSPPEVSRPEETAEAAPYPELLDMFRGEAEEKLRLIQRSLPQYLNAPDRRDGLGEIRRSVHSLKGEAYVVGLPVLGHFAHRLEDLLDALFDGEAAFSPEIGEVLVLSGDVLEDLCLTTAPNPDLRTTAETLSRRIERLLPENQSDRMEPVAPMAVEEPLPVAPSEQSEELVVRVPLSRLDGLVRLLGELVINHSTFQENLSGIQREVEELQMGADRMGRLTGKLESEYEVTALGSRRVASLPVFSGSAQIAGRWGNFDALEMDHYNEFHLVSRQITETNSDVSTSGHKLGLLSGDYDTLVNRLGRLTNEIQDKLMGLRMIPFGTLSGKLQRTVRVTASKTGKAASLLLSGEEIELDKSLIEAVSEPLAHLLRNALDHGIEPRAERIALGKPPEGTLSVRLTQEGTEVVIRVADDGGGLNLEQLRRKAVSNGLKSEAEAAGLSDSELAELMFLPGFSTAREISEISGRGVGLDVVRETVRRLKGAIFVDQTTGAGTVFTLRFPLSLSVSKAFLVRTGGEMFALPFALVSRVFQAPADTMQEIGHARYIPIRDRIFRVLDLAQSLALPARTDTPEGLLSFLLIETGGTPMAVLVDEILEQRDIVMKPLGNHVRRLRGFSGATLLGDGRVVLILNPAELVLPETKRAESSPVSRSARRDEPVRVLVVDDSLSIRTVVGNLIRQNGWTPVFARDGVEALQVIQSGERLPDVIVSDIEMPRMDGFELTSTLRANPGYRALPVVMLTSRAGDKHRRQAFEVGVSDYFVKPFEGEKLAAAIRALARKGIHREG